MEKREIYAKRFLIVLLIGFSLILVIKPDILPENVVFGSSFEDIENQKMELNSINDEITHKKQYVENERDSALMYKEDEERLSNEADKSRKEINENDLKFHLPSIMIRLEDQAVKDKLKIEIEHKNMQTYDGDESMSDDYDDYDDSYTEETDEDDEVEEDEDLENDGQGGEEYSTEDNELENKMDDEIDDELDDEKTDNKDAEVKKDNENEKEEKESDDLDKKEIKEEGDKAEQEDDEISGKHIDSDIDNGKIPLISGFQTTIIPIRVNGQYEQIRSFIKYIDELNYLNPISITLYSSGDIVDGYIIISAIHRYQ